MIFDFIDWDEHNLEHATRRLTVQEIEQAIWNADGTTMQTSKDSPDRRLIPSSTNGGKRVVVVIQVVGTGVRPITGWED